jgi:microcin C transport system substrate-binding protein
MIVSGLSQSQLPGKELMNYWHSSVINEEGARNYAGVNNPVIDDLIEKIVTTNSREQRVAMAKAIDRILLYGEYLVPNWYIAYHRVAYWNRFNLPAITPLFYEPTPWALQTWWLKEKEGNQ